MLKKEWKSLFKSPIMIIVLIAIILIPSIYTCLFLASMWDPYGELDKLPVAVVNNDKPVEYNEKTLQVGQDLVDKLKDNDELDFHFVDPMEAQEGIENGTYYMVITIPENFSENASTVMDDEPTQMVLNYETNPGTNYIASKLSATAMTKIKDTLSEEIVRTYTEEVFDSIAEAGDGMQDAADGAGEIEDGTDKLIDGNDTISENLQVLADSTVTFKNGSKTLTTGLKTYTDGVAQVDAGATQLADGTSTLKDGTTTLSSGIKSYTDGVAQVDVGAKQLKDGTSQLADGSKQLDDGAAQLQTGAATLKKGTSSLYDGASSLYAGAKTLSSGASDLNTGLTAYVAGVRQLHDGADKMAGLTGLDKVYAGISALEAGVNTGSTEKPALTKGAEAVYNDLAGIDATLDQLLGTASTQELKELTEDINTAQKTASAGASQAGDAKKTTSNAATAASDAQATIQTATQKLEESANSVNAAIDENNSAVASSVSAVNEKIDGVNGEIKDGNDKVDKNNATIDKAIAAIDEAINAAESDDVKNRLQAAKETLNGNKLAKMSEVSSVSKDDLSVSTIAEDKKVSVSDETQTLQDKASALSAAADTLDKKESALASAASTFSDIEGNRSVDTRSLSTLSQKIKQLKDGAKAVKDGADSVGSNLTALKTQTASFPEAAEGMTKLIAGFDQVSGAMLANGQYTNDYKLTAGASSLADGAQTLVKGAATLSGGAKQVDDGTQTLAAGTKTLKAGTESAVAGTAQLDAGALTLTKGTAALVANNDTLNAGANQLFEGAVALAEGAQTLKAGTSALVANNAALNSGAAQLTDGAGKIQDGSQKLADGSVELGDGLHELKDGANELSTALQDGADEVKDNTASDATLDMFSAPVDAEETQVTTVNDNGSAMSAYMMCVGLWVGALAFCLLYPLTKYRGKLKGGFSWWISKASVAYPAAVLMGLIVVGVAHVSLGFTPGDLGKELTIACLACVAFMSMQYFANVALGKVGSFLMLVFMVIQLAGSAGTYPVEISGELANALHAYVPFTYVVNGFRVGICGAGSITQSVQVLISIIIVFTILTVILFQYRTIMIRREKRCFYDFLEDHGLA